MTHFMPQAASLDAAYARCRELHRAHGRSYYLATRLLPAWKRRHVHALYGVTRCTDDIVDGGGGAETARGGPGRARQLEAWASRFYAAVDGAQVPAEPILLAPDDGPGPVPAAAAAVAREPARQRGLAFQLTNFIRDVAEDLDRGRVYLPAADLDSFGVRRVDLAAPPASPAVRALIAFEIERARAHYRRALPGLAALPARSRRCVRLAYAVYGGILDRIEQADCDVLAGRAVVPRRQRAAAVVRELARSA